MSSLAIYCLNSFTAKLEQVMHLLFTCWQRERHLRICPKTEQCQRSDIQFHFTGEALAENLKELIVR